MFVVDIRFDVSVRTPRFSVCVFVLAGVFSFGFASVNVIWIRCLEH